MSIGLNKFQAQALFSHHTQGFQLETAWVEDELVSTPENYGLVLLKAYLLQALLPWFRIETSQMDIPVVTNVEAWRTTALWSDDVGMISNPDAPVWMNETVSLGQLAAQLTIDTAVDQGQAVYNVSDAAMRALAEMMMTAVWTQILSKTPDPKGPKGFFGFATDDSRVSSIDAPLSLDALMCLRQSIDLDLGISDQYSIIMSRDVYADFVKLMTGVGLRPEIDRVTKRKEWSFDRVRVVESGYVADGNAMIFKADTTALPEDMRRQASSSISRGCGIVSNHQAGVVVSSPATKAGVDQDTTFLQMSLALLAFPNCVGWAENIET